MGSESANQIFLIYGDEEYLRCEALDTAVASFSVVMPELNINTFGEDSDVHDIIMACDTLPMMSEWRVVIVKNSQLFSAGASAAKQIAEYIPQMPQCSALIFEAQSVDKRNALYKAVSKHGKVVACEKVREWDMQKQILRIAKKLNIGLSSGAAQELAMRYSDLAAVKTELLKLSSMKKNLTEEDIKEYSATSLEYEVFKMSKMLANGDFEGGLDLFTSVYEEEKSPFGVIAITAMKLRDMLHARAMLDIGRQPAEISQIIGNKWAAAEAISGAKKFTAKHLRDSITMLSELEAGLKSDRGDMFQSTRLALIKAYSPD